MTRQKHKKARVRARMAVTGENYTTALRALEAQRGQNVDFDGTVHDDEEEHPLLQTPAVAVLEPRREVVLDPHDRAVEVFRSPRRRSPGAPA